MYEEQAEAVQEYGSRLDEISKALNVDNLRSQIAELEGVMAGANFWDDPEQAQKVVKNLKGLKAVVGAPESLRQEIEDAEVLIDLGQTEGDATLEGEINQNLEDIEKKLNQIEITSLFSDPRDQKDAIISIHPGAGGTESCDWAGMLYRMILRYCEREGFDVEIMDEQPGEEAGLKSATITASGPFAYGKLKSEAGVHRLVRISPFDANKRRHTSFAAIEVLAPIDEDIEVEVRDEDVKMDVFRSSGAGGQKVNKTSSAVRLTHLPTGIVVSCQIERSQHRNRDTAMNMLKAKLYDIELKKKEDELAAQREDHREVNFGSQIRSYVMQPYQMVKDLRTGVETSNVDRVLDGELDEFIQAYLKWKLAARKN